jgi:restriction endonuclease S subunit
MRKKIEEVKKELDPITAEIAEHDKVLKTLIAEIEELAKIVVKDYEENPSEMSGSITQVHESSPYLATKEERLIKKK